MSEHNSIESVYLTYYQINRDVILNRAKDYYENYKERLRELARDKYRNLSEEEKNKKGEYGKNKYHNMSEGKKKKPKRISKNYREAKSLDKIINKISFLLWFLVMQMVINKIVS